MESPSSNISWSGDACVLIGKQKIYGGSSDDAVWWIGVNIPRDLNGSKEEVCQRPTTNHDHWFGSKSTLVIFLLSKDAQRLAKEIIQCLDMFSTYQKVI